MDAANPDFRENGPILDSLLEKADLQGHLTMGDLEEIIPRSGSTTEVLDELVGVLAEQGIEVVYQEEEEDVSEENSDSETDMDPMAGFTRVPTDDTISLYLREMSQVPLLNMEQEVSLSKRYEAGRAARDKLIKQSKKCPPDVLLQLAQTEEDGLLAREHLIKANTRLVVSVAKRYTGRGVPFLDLIQEGNLGLMKAVEKFDYRRGFRFSTYATWWIRQTITRSIADQGRTIRVPVHMVDRIRVMYKSIHELEQRFGREPTIDELSEMLEMPKDKVEWMIRVSWLPLSLETPINDDEDESELGNFVEDRDTPTPPQSVYSKLLSEKIEEILDALPFREARILRLRFGLENGRFYTLEEVGKKFGLTRERIRQLETKALRRLRHPRKSGQLREYL
ncbi:MAG TPA: sigma-70 family RNA polymerase sigma factor [Pelolinea sp.]|nr:sigma-70 family RNA polymerase sigma factor [Pelolinea sp.]